MKPGGAIYMRDKNTTEQVFYAEKWAKRRNREIGSFKVPIIYTINRFIIYFIIHNGVIKNVLINGFFFE